MPRLALRRSSSSITPALAGAIALGLGLGAVAGFLIGELAGPTASRALKGNRSVPASKRPRVAKLVAKAQEALDDDLVLRDCHLHVVAVGPGRIELHGWVTDRRSRARAAHLVSDRVDAEAIINCLLVRGEDDLVTTEDDDTTDERMA